jgi:hypothetical protein
VNRSNKAVIIRALAQGLADDPDGLGEDVFLDSGMGAPDRVQQFLFCYDLAAPLNQNEQQIYRLRRQLDQLLVPGQQPVRSIQPKNVEFVDLLFDVGHGARKSP